MAKRDQGREATWRRVVREQGRSGLTVREFCRRSRLPESAFYFWRRELRRRRVRRPPSRGRRTAGTGPPDAAAPAFVAVRVGDPDRAGGRLEIELPGGRRVNVVGCVDRQALADVLAVLEGRPSCAKATEGQPC